MRVSVSFIILGCLFLFSCQKEVDFANRTGNGNSTGSDELIGKDRQKKMAMDSLVSRIHWYNANKKLIGLKMTGTDQGADCK